MSNASAEPALPFTERERQLGRLLLHLLLRWPEWVHRRVETVYFETAETYRRRLSIDFTIPDGLESPIVDGDGQPIFFTPLTLLKKNPLTNFDIHDETGRALPLVTKSRNGSLAASLLSALASATVSSKLRERYGEMPPRDIDDALIKIAYSDADHAELVARLLSPPQGTTPASREWRTELSSQKHFEEFVTALSWNYLVIVPLSGPPNMRRVLKLAYDEPPQTQSITPADTRAHRFSRRVLAVLYGERFARRTRNRTQRRIPGEGVWSYGVRGLRRAFGITAHLRLIIVPAASYGSSYHLEFVAPDGLIVTRASLASFGPEGGAPKLEQLLVESRRRAQLYLKNRLARPPFGTEAIALAHLRAAPSTLVRATALLSAFTTALLLFVTLRWESLVENTGSAPSLLLIVPAGLAALITRPGEASITTRLLLGTRLAATSIGLSAFVAAAILVGGHSCKPTLFSKACGTWSSAPTLLWILVAISAVTTFVLTLAWHFSALPPEQRAPDS